MQKTNNVEKNEVFKELELSDLEYVEGGNASRNSIWESIKEYVLDIFRAND